MEVAWAALGLLAAALFGEHFYIGSRFDRTDSKIDSKFDALTARIDTTNARIDALSADLGGRLDAHLDSHSR